MDDATRWCEIENKNDRECKLAVHLNNMYRLDALEQMVRLPAEMGIGYWQRIRPLPVAELVHCDARFHENMTLSNREGENCVVIGFCLGDPIWWNVEGKRGDFGLGSGEVSAYSSTYDSNCCEYDVHRHFQGLTLKLHLLHAHTLEHLPLDRVMSALSGQTGQFFTSKMTPGMKRIIHEITHCRYAGDVKQIFLSAKVLELIAVYVGEALLEKSEPLSIINLSRTDIASLQRAKEILDANLLSPPGLGALARQVCLNEYKLKKGFKQLFGLPVHAYVIDQRLLMASHMLEEGTVNITEAAYAVGFSKTGHFSEQFKRKYGVNPSEYFRHG